MAAMDRDTGTRNRLETASREERAAAGWREIEKLLVAAYEGSAEFRSRMEQAGTTPADIASYDDFTRLPVLAKKQLMGVQQSRGVEALTTCALGGLSRIYQSPGPLYDPEGRGPDYWGWAEAFYATGFRKGDLVQNTFSYHLTPAGLMLEEPLREIGCAVIPAGPGNTDVQIELMTTLPVTGFVGMCSYLKVIADKAAAKGFDLRRDFRLETAFVAAERLPESLRREVEEAFGMRIRQGYGTADVGCIAYECPALSGMHLTSRGLVEICDPVTHLPVAPGETGEVVFTPFSREYPLIRLATGDLSYLVEEPCECGRTSRRLGGIVGRVDDTAKVKGQFIYPAQAAEVMAGFEAIDDWQLVVDNPGGRDCLSVRLSLSGELDEEVFVRAFAARCKLRPVVVRLGPGESIDESAAKLVDVRSFD